MDMKSIVLAVLVSFMFGLAGSYWIFDSRLQSLEQKVDSAPPLAILDFAEIAMSYPDGATPEEMDDLMMATNNAVVKLVNAGFIVLDRSAIVQAPKELFLEKSIIMESKGVSQ